VSAVGSDERFDSAERFAQVFRDLWEQKYGAKGYAASLNVGDLIQQVRELDGERIHEELIRLVIRDVAQRQFSVARARELGNAPPDLMELPSAEEWFEEPDDDFDYVIDPLLMRGHNALLSGGAKAGKTTLVADLVGCLTRRESVWMDQFALSTLRGKVGWVNYEMPGPQLKRWLRTARVNPKRFAMPLNLRSNGPNFLDDEWWEFIRDWINDQKVTFLVLDSLTEMVSAAGLDEDKDGVEVLAAVNRLREQTTLSEVLVIAHFGHNGERTRGTSKFNGWVDVPMKLIREERSGQPDRRYFSAFGRDVAFPESEVKRMGDGTLVVDPGLGRRAASAREDSAAQQRRKAEKAELLQTVYGAVSREPGCSASRLRADGGAWCVQHVTHRGQGRVEFHGYRGRFFGGI
jgi:hypothetical protein